MTALPPKGTCPVCGRFIRLSSNGRLYPHMMAGLQVPLPRCRPDPT